MQLPAASAEAVMDRRAFLGALGLFGAARAVEAQPAGKVPRIGYLAFDLTGGDPRPREAFLQGLRDLGHVEGRTFVIEYRDAEGKTERRPGLAAELVALKVDVIVPTAGTLGTLAAKRATTTLPIVFPAVGDPVSEGIVPASRGPAAISPGSPSSRRSSSSSRWRCSSRPFPAPAGPPYW